MATYNLNDMTSLYDVKPGDTIITAQKTYIVPKQPKLKVFPNKPNNAYLGLYLGGTRGWNIQKLITSATEYTYITPSHPGVSGTVCVEIKKKSKKRTNLNFEPMLTRPSCIWAVISYLDGDIVIGGICPVCGRTINIKTNEKEVRSAEIEKRYIADNMELADRKVGSNTITTVEKYIQTKEEDPDEDFQYIEEDEDIEEEQIYRVVTFKAVTMTHTCGAKYTMKIHNDWTSGNYIKVTKNVTETHARYHVCVQTAIIKNKHVNFRKEMYGVTFRKKDRNAFSYTILPRKRSGVFRTNELNPSYASFEIMKDAMAWMGGPAKGDPRFYDSVYHHYGIFRRMIKNAPRMAEELFKHDKFYQIIGDDVAKRLLIEYKGDMGLLEFVKKRYGRGATVPLIIDDFGKYGMGIEKLNNELSDVRIEYRYVVRDILNEADGVDGIVEAGGCKLTPAVVSKIAKLGKRMDGPAYKNKNYQMLGYIRDIANMCSPLETNIAYHTMTVTQLIRHHDRLIERGTRRYDITNEDLAAACATYDKYNSTVDGYIFTALTTVEQLNSEGNEMHHCVASYADNVARGKSIILSIRKDEEKATMEVANNQIVQVRAVSNRAVSSRLMSAVRKWAAGFGFSINRNGYNEIQA